MIFVSIVLFCLAVLLGLLLVVVGLRYQRGSLLLAVGHVSFAMLGLGVLGWQVYDDSVYKLYNISTLLFCFALSGGLILLGLRLKNREYRTPPPMFLVALHAIMAMLALLLLVVGYSKYNRRALTLSELGADVLFK